MLWQRFTERARKVIFYAQEEAQQLGETQVSTEHLLLGLMRESDSVAARILDRMGVSLQRIRNEIERYLTRSEARYGAEMQLTLRAKRVIDLAYDEARQLNNNYIGTEHLLLGLIREGEGLAARVLSKLGVTLEAARQVTAQIQDEPRTPPSPAPKRPKLYHPRLSEYLESLVPPRPAILQAMEAHARATDFPIVGPMVGQFFYLITRLTGATRVFELGSGFGYSTAWFALAVRENGGGEVHHVVWDENLSQQAQEFLRGLDLLDIVRFHVGEAVQTLQQVGGEYDIIFCDIDKDGYPASWQVVKQHLRVGGVALYDNMLWSGRIWDDSDTFAATQGVHELTRLISEDSDFTFSLLPIRDGVLMAMKLR